MGLLGRAPDLLESLRGPSDDEKENLGVLVSEVRRLLDAALSAGVSRDLFTALHLLAENGASIERAIIVWIDLIEVLVQEQERRWGPRAGLGRFKSAELKSVLHRLLRNQKLGLPGIPGELMPLVIDYLADWLVDVIVMSCNRHGLWDSVPPRSGYPLRVLLARLKDFLGRLFSPLVRAIVAVVLWLRRVMEEQVVLSRQLQAAVSAVQSDGLLNETDKVVRGVIDLFVWVGRHRNQVVAAVELVFVAVQEAEKYESMTGAEKKEYAMALVFAALDELGFRQKAGLLVATLESIIGGGVESAVHLFNKHAVFTHRVVSQPLPA